MSSPRETDGDFNLLIICRLFLFSNLKVGRLAVMSIVVTVKYGDKKVSRSTYEPGFLVDNDISRQYSRAQIKITIHDHQQRTLAGNWPEALDQYFNSWSFRTSPKLIPDETTRCGCANEHRSLFLTAVRLLEKSLKNEGYRVEVEFL